MGQSFIRLLPEGHKADKNVMALASFKLERFIPSNGATTFVLGNNPIADFTAVFKNGVRLDPGA